MSDIQPSPALDSIARRIFEIRGQRVMLDSDLAALYGVETGALVRATKRNLGRFPEDFIFQLSYGEWENLKCQIGISRSWGGTRKAPYAFTEHGSIMLSAVLNSPRAKEISVLVVRAFIWMRQTVPAYKELADKVAELEAAVGRHDVALGGIIETLHELILPPDKEKRRIGF